MEYQYQLTVITVVYNGAELLDKTIRSIARQKTSSVQYVVVDGNSTDDTVDLIKMHPETIDQWISEPDKGIFDAMSKGIAMANGQWIIFINAGDQLIGNCLPNVPLDEKSDAGILYGNTIRDRYRRTFPYALKMIETGNLPMCHQATFYNREVLGREMYYNADYRLFAENELFMRIYKAGIPCRYIDTDIAFFLGGGVSSTVNNETRKAKYRFLLSNFGLIGVLKAIALKAGLLKKEAYRLRQDEPLSNEGAIIE